MRGFEYRLARLEGVRACPLCEEARAALLESIVTNKPGDSTSRYCRGCGRDVRLTIEEVDAILRTAEGEGA